MKRRGFFKAVAAGLCALFAGKALADLPCVGTVPESDTPPGKWTHLVIIRQNGHCRAFVDGKLLAVQYWSRALSTAEVEVLFETESELHGQALSIAGVGDYVDVPDSGTSMSDGFTIDAWIPPAKGKETTNGA